MARLKLQSPWIQFYDEIEVFFEEDPEVRVIYDEYEDEIRLYVDNPQKAEALTNVLPAEKEYGNITLKVTVIPSNTDTAVGDIPRLKSDILQALSGNPIVDDFKIVTGIFANDIVYVVFRKEVVQYFNDNLGDANGNCSTLYQDIAKRIFNEIPGVYFCTSEDDHEIAIVPDWP